MIIDAHQHYWHAPDARMDDVQDAPGALAHAFAIAGRPELAEQDLDPPVVEGDLRTAGVEGTVLVQAVDTARENARLAAWALRTPTVAGVVAWTGAPYDEIPRLVGVRSLEARDSFDLGLRDDLAFDVVPITPDHVRAVCALADERPELRIVVDHLARPPLGGGDWAEWEAGVRALGARPNVAMKVSVGVAVLTHWTWDGDALARPVEHAIECFGSERLMLASNWPVVLMRAPYLQAWHDLAGACRWDPEILGGTAARWYRLPA